MLESEKERVRFVEQVLNDSHSLFDEQYGELLPPEAISLIIGSMLAAVDAVFAIRDGESWRGLSDPKEIAAQLLRDAHLGER